MAIEMFHVTLRLSGNVYGAGCGYHGRADTGSDVSVYDVYYTF